MIVRLDFHQLYQNYAHPSGGVTECKTPNYPQITHPVSMRYPIVTVKQLSVCLYCWLTLGVRSVCLAAICMPIHPASVADRHKCYGFRMSTAVSRTDRHTLIKLNKTDKIKFGYVCHVTNIKRQHTHKSRAPLFCWLSFGRYSEAKQWTSLFCPQRMLWYVLSTIHDSHIRE